MHQLRNFLNGLEYHELLRIKQQIEQGTFSFEKEVRKKLRELEKKHATFCASCSNDLDLCNSNNYTILFGPEDFKKKASFCGLDCLEYFLSHIKKAKGDTYEKVK